MRYLSFAILVFTYFFAISGIDAQQVDKNLVREKYFTIANSEGVALQLYNMLENRDLTYDPVLLAYRGAASAAAAGTAKGVSTKLKFFNRGKAELETAISRKPLDAEIRFLRLATQMKAPGFLGYNSDIKNDKTLIIATMKSVASNHANAYLYHRICGFLLSDPEINPEDKESVSQLFIKFKPK